MEINKRIFTTLDPSQQTTETTPEQTKVEGAATELGEVSSVPDSVEHLNASSFELFTQVATPEIALPPDPGVGEQAAPNQSFGADSLQFHDAMNAVRSSVAFQQPKVDWDTISFLEQESAKANPDQSAMFDALQNMSSGDRALTLQQLASQGTPPNSDFDKLIQKMYGQGGAAKSEEMGKLLGTLTRDLKNNPQVGPLISDAISDIEKSQLISPPEGAPPGYVGDDTMRAFIKDIWDDGASDLLQNLPADTLNNVGDMLRSGDLYEPQDVFFNDTVRYAGFVKQGFSESEAAAKSEALKTQDLNMLFDANLGQKTPMCGELLAMFGGWNTDKLMSLTPDQMTKLVTSLEGGGGNWTSQLLGNLSSQAPGNSQITDVMRRLLDSLETAQQNGDKGADDAIRQMISGWGANAVDDLSKLSPQLLIQMSILLNNGDDSAANAASKSIVDQAFNIAKTR